MSDGAGEGEGGLRISPWWAKFVDGRFMANATTGEIACFGEHQAEVLPVHRMARGELDRTLHQRQAFGAAA